MLFLGPRIQLIAAIIFACLLGSRPSSAGELKPGTGAPMSEDLSVDARRGISRDPVDTLYEIKNLLLKYGHTGLPDSLDFNYNMQWAGVGYDCKDGVSEGSSPALADICDGQYVIAAGYNLMAMTGECAVRDANNCLREPRPTQIDAIAFVLAHEMVHLIRRDPLAAGRKELSPAELATFCTTWGRNYINAPEGAAAVSQIVEPLVRQGKSIKEQRTAAVNKIVQDCVAFKNHQDETQVRQTMLDQETRADDEATAILAAYNAQSKPPGTLYPFFNLGGGYCAMAKLRDLEWASASDSLDMNHPDSGARARRIAEIADGIPASLGGFAVPAD